MAPNGVAYAPASARPGVIPRLLREILATRVMVKAGMKRAGGGARVLQRVLNARQFGLKLIANVTYGYTAAGFSGRMPCAELADSIVQSARETLENAIRMVEAHPGARARAWLRAWLTAGRPTEGFVIQTTPAFDCRAPSWPVPSCNWVARCWRAPPTWCRRTQARACVTASAICMVKAHPCTHLGDCGMRMCAGRCRYTPADAFASREALSEQSPLTFIGMCARRAVLQDRCADSWQGRGAEWRARVVYGDTDSLFVLLPGRSRADAFAVGAEIAAGITAANPPPVTLKLEKARARAATRALGTLLHQRCRARPSRLPCPPSPAACYAHTLLCEAKPRSIWL